MLVVRVGTVLVSTVDHGLDKSQQIVQVSVARRTVLLLNSTKEAASVLQLLTYHLIILSVWIPELIMIDWRNRFSHSRYIRRTSDSATSLALRVARVATGDTRECSAAACE